MDGRRSPTRRITLSQKSVDKLSCPVSGRITVYDDKTDGLGVRLDANGTKSFFWFRKVRGVPTFRAIGNFPDVTVEKACDTAQEWNGKLAEWKRHDYEGENPFERKREDLTLGGVLEKYVAQRVQKKASHPERAEKATRWMFDKYLSVLRGRKLGAISRTEVRDIHERLSSESGKVTADRCVQLLRRMYNWAASEKVEIWQGENPATKIELNGDTKRDRFLSPEELVRLDSALKKEEASNPDLVHFVELCLATGARRSNVLGMRWEEINWAHKVWIIPGSSSKNAKPMVLALTRRAVKVLEDRKRTAVEGTSFVFPSTSKSGHLVEMKRTWRGLLERAKIADCKIHDLRRTAASYQAIAGQTLQAIAASLGHRSTASTEIYARLNTDAMRKSLVAGQNMMTRTMAAARKKNRRRKAA